MEVDSGPLEDNVVHFHNCCREGIYIYTYLDLQGVSNAGPLVV